MGKVKQQNTTLNFLKGLACIAVVILHSGLSQMIGTVIPTFVNLFFLISGYYAYSSTPDNYLSIRKKMFRTLKMLGYSMVFYLVYSLIYCTLQGDIAYYIVYLKGSFSLKNFLLLNDLDFLMATHLWFLMALVYAYLLLMITQRFKLTKYVYFLLPVVGFFIIYTDIGVITGRLSFHLNDNALRSVFYVYTGFILAENKEKISKLGKKLPLIVAILIQLLITGTVVAIAVLGKSSVILKCAFALMIIIPIGVFVWALNNPTAINSRFWNTFGGKYSLHVYIFHVAFLSIQSLILEKMGIDASVSWITLCRTVIAIVVSVLFGKLLSYVRKKN